MTDDRHDRQENVEEPEAVQESAVADPAVSATAVEPEPETEEVHEDIADRSEDDTEVGADGEPPEIEEEAPVPEEMVQIGEPEPEPATAEQVAHLSARVAEAVGLLGGMARQQELIPQQIRRISRQVEEVATSTSEPRLRDTLKSLLILYDLVGQMHAQTSEDDEPHRTNYSNVAVQIRQMLDHAGLFIIDGTGPFDPSVHRPVKAVPCASPEEAGQIVELVRPGFRTPHSVLRYAEIVLTRYEGEDDAGEDASATTETPEIAEDQQATENREDSR